MHEITNVVLTGGHLWDGVSDEVRRETAVHICPDGRFGQIGTPADVLASAPDAKVIDVAGAYLSPGLINMHVHFGLALPGKMAEVVAAGGPSAMVLLMSGNATQTLESGVTTVRLVGEPDFHDFALRQAVDTGHVRGPRIFTPVTPFAARVATDTIPMRWKQTGRTGSVAPPVCSCVLVLTSSRCASRVGLPGNTNLSTPRN